MKNVESKKSGCTIIGAMYVLVKITQEVRMMKCEFCNKKAVEGFTACRYHEDQAEEL